MNQVWLPSFSGTVHASHLPVPRMRCSPNLQVLKRFLRRSIALKLGSALCNGLMQLPRHEA
jgi:hypothetical protein